MRPHKRVFAIVVFLLASASSLAGVAETGVAGDGPKRAPELRNPDYVGHVVGKPHVRVAIRVERKRRGGQRVVFQAQDEPQVCETGIKRVTGPIGSRGLSRSGHFDALYTEGPADGGSGIAFALAHGSLGDQHAEGFLFTAFHPNDSGTQSYNADECWTDGKLRWRARRVDSEASERRLAKGSARLADGAGRKRSAAASFVKLRSIGRADDRVEVRARFTVGCDDGKRRRELSPIVVPVRGGRFERLLYHQTRSKRRTFTWIRGKIGPQGRARGGFSRFEDPWDPPGTMNRPECVRGPVIQWRTRVR